MHVLSPYSRAISSHTVLASCNLTTEHRPGAASTTLLYSHLALGVHRRFFSLYTDRPTNCVVRSKRFTAHMFDRKSTRSSLSSAMSFLTMDRRYSSTSALLGRPDSNLSGATSLSTMDRTYASTSALRALAGSSLSTAMSLLTVVRTYPSTSALLALPDEIKLEIASNLVFADKYALLNTCRRFRFFFGHVWHDLAPTKMELYTARLEQERQMHESFDNARMRRTCSNCTRLLPFYHFSIPQFRKETGRCRCISCTRRQYSIKWVKILRFDSGGCYGRLQLQDESVPFKTILWERLGEDPSKAVIKSLLYKLDKVVFAGGMDFAVLENFYLRHRSEEGPLNVYSDEFLCAILGLEEIPAPSDKQM